MDEPKNLGGADRRGAVVGGLGVAVWSQNKLGPPKLKALAGMKPDFQVAVDAMPADVYILRSSRAVAVRRPEQITHDLCAYREVFCDLRASGGN